MLDTNVLLLFIMGAIDARLLGQARRVKQFVPNDFQLVSEYVSLFDRVHMTPNTATEASNLLRQLSGDRALETLRLLAALCRSEQYVASAVAPNRPEFLRFGLTDSVLLRLCAEGITLLTDDEPLYLAGCAEGFSVQLFSDLRPT